MATGAVASEFRTHLFSRLKFGNCAVVHSFNILLFLLGKTILILQPDATTEKTAETESFTTASVMPLRSQPSFEGSPSSSQLALHDDMTRTPYDFPVICVTNGTTLSCPEGCKMEEARLSCIFATGNSAKWLMAGNAESVVDDQQPGDRFDALLHLYPWRSRY